MIMRSVRRFPMLLLACLVAAGLAGCGTIKNPVVAFSDDGEVLPNPAGDGLVVDPDSPIPDVPIPIGFKAVASKSSSTVSGGTRIVNHYYQGRAIRGQTTAFYKSYLPRYDWKLSDQSTAGDTTTLRYTKGAERLELSVRFYNGVASVSVNIGPR